MAKPSKRGNGRGAGPRPAPPGNASPEHSDILPIVGLGASAGGLEAFQKFFTHMPADSGMAFVVVQHLDPHHQTLMPELLGKVTSMSVEQVQDETPARADHVYVIPPNATLRLEGGIIRVKEPPESRFPMAIDRLFDSLAEDQGHGAIGLLFSGAGNDGTLGLRRIKELGGLTMVQSPESAKHDSLLRSAIATGMVDYVLPAEEMPAKLVEYAAHFRLLAAQSARQELFEGTAELLSRITTILHRQTGHDFSRYKAPTLIRRIQRRMQVLQIATVTDYLDRLRAAPGEADELFRDLLIGVTHFFRDASAFEALARDVIPQLFDHARESRTLRIWTPACATGEETFSIAMLVLEEMARRDVVFSVRIFGGDIDEEALETARQGRYSESIAEHVSPERLARFFVKQGVGYQVSKPVRELCVFSTHNVIRDPPFSHLDLAVCRNLLIYLETDLQQRLANICHYALRKGGYLFLGPSESVAAPELFRTVDKKHRIFQRNEIVSLPIAVPMGQRTELPRRGRLWTPRIPIAGQPEVVATLERVLLDHYTPPWVIVNAQGESVYFSPRTGRFLEPAPGSATMDIVGMARKGLRLDLRTAIHQAVKTGETVTHADVRVEGDPESQRISLVVRPLTELGQDPGLFLVVFQDAVADTQGKETAAGAAHVSGDQLVQQLESELRITKEHLQATVEELETSYEELKSSNEEMVSTNEELQSSNEELQTSKEELQSINEELQTINSELSQKVEELDVANGDLQNLLQSTQIPTLFLDNDLRIKRFTEAATTVFRLIDGDVGRPITDLAHRFDADVASDLAEVRRTLSTKERQISLADGSATYLMRVLPYRRLDNVIDGLVLTFLDVTRLNHALEQAERLATIVASSQDAIVGRSLDGTILTWNAGAEHMFGYPEAEAVGQPISLIVPAEGMGDVERLHERLQAGDSVPPYESVSVTRAGQRLEVSVAVSLLSDREGRPFGVSTIFRDIGKLKAAQEALRKEVRERDRFLYLLSHELRNPLAPLRTSLEILKQAGLPPQDTDKALRVMDRQLSHLTSLVDQLMDAARVASGKLVLEREDVDMVPLLRSVAEDHAKQFLAAGLILDVRLPDRPLFFRGDRVRMSQALGNLLGNALKFTQTAGTVILSARADDERHMTVTVTDTGIGVAPELLERLFQPFVQGRSESGQGHGGLGLGLALVRELVESHGGTVEARSGGLGHGVAVSLHLPLLTEPQRARAQTQAAPGAGASRLTRRVLIIEDNVDAGESLMHLLRLWGCDVQIAATGRAGVGMVASFKPDVVLCDLHLPGDMDGFSVAQAVKADPQLGSPCLVALTGFGQDRDRERTRLAGFDRHLTKPADIDLLRQILTDLPRSR